MLKSAYRPLPDNLRSVIEMEKTEMDGRLRKFATDVKQFLTKQHNLPRELRAYLSSIEAIADVFRLAPASAYKDLEIRDRKKFSKEVKELSEEPIHHYKHIVEMMKAVNEVLEKILFRTKFFGSDEPHKK